MHDRSQYDADIARFSSEHGVFGNTIDDLYEMLKRWELSGHIELAGSERKLKLDEKQYHVVCDLRNYTYNIYILHMKDRIRYVYVVVVVISFEFYRLNLNSKKERIFVHHFHLMLLIT